MIMKYRNCLMICGTLPKLIKSKWLLFQLFLLFTFTPLLTPLRNTPSLGLCDCPPPPIYGPFSGGLLSCPQVPAGGAQDLPSGHLRLSPQTLWNSQSSRGCTCWWLTDLPRHRPIAAELESRQLSISSAFTFLSLPHKPTPSSIFPISIGDIPWCHYSRLSCPLPPTALATITKYHRLGRLNNRGGCKSKMEVLADVVPGESSLPGLLPSCCAFAWGGVERKASSHSFLLQGH